MKEIVLKSTDVSDKKVVFNFSYSEELSSFFRDTKFILEYSESIAEVPEEVLNIVFVANVLPIIWITDTVLKIKKLDKAFFDCLTDLKNGYVDMYPETDFLGKIAVEEIIESKRKCDEGKCAMFYSGGVDSVNTLINHFDSKPVLVSIWGSDVDYDNADGWKPILNNLINTSEQYDLPYVTVHSSFREFDNEYNLNRRYSAQLQASWWLGVKHGISIISHAAPIAYIHNLQTVYIASSYNKNDIDVRGASYPTLDNCVRFCDCKIIHDGFELNRQERINNIVRFCKERDIRFSLHVCWESQSGTNCGHCEKCCRTMVGIFTAGGEPEEYGFTDVRKNMSKIKENLFEVERYYYDFRVLWDDIQKDFIKNADMLKKSPYWKYTKWILKADFLHPETLKIPLHVRIRKAEKFRNKLSHFKFYQLLHNIKSRG